MIRLFRHPWGWASLAPLVCAVHCLATPVLVVTAPSLVPGDWAEWALLAVTVVVAAVATGIGRRAHGETGPMALAAAGLGVWVASLLHVFHPVSEELTTAAAALAVATALVWNSRLHCARRDVACTACRLEGTEELDAGQRVVGASTTLEVTARVEP